MVFSLNGITKSQPCVGTLPARLHLPLTGLGLLPAFFYNSSLIRLFDIIYRAFSEVSSLCDPWQISLNLSTNGCELILTVMLWWYSKWGASTAQPKKKTRKVYDTIRAVFSPQEMRGNIDDYLVLKCYRKATTANGKTY